MLRLCVLRATPGVLGGPPGVRRVPGRQMGTRGRPDPPGLLQSPRRAQDFIYRLHPAERSCLLQELQSLQSLDPHGGY